jgi:PAS domain S-box-containing protein
MTNSAVREAIKLLARASTQGLDAFDIATQALADGLDCRWAGIAAVAGREGDLEILAACDGAAALSKTRFAAAESAAASLYRTVGRDRCCIHHADIIRQFPHDPMLAGRKIRFFAACAFSGADGLPAGHVFVMDDRPRDESGDGDVRELLALVARRVGDDLSAAKRARASSGVEDGWQVLDGVASVVSWEMAPGLRRLTSVSQPAEALFGYDLESWYENDVWLDRVRKSDRERVKAALALACDGGTAADFEFRIRTSGGKEIWIWGMVQQRAFTGDGTRLRGLWIDLTRQKAVQRELTETVQRFRDFAEADTDWFWEMDENLRFSFFSEQFEEAVGTNPAMLIGRDRRQLLVLHGFYVDDFCTEEDWEQHIQVLEAHEPFQDFRHSRRSESGQILYLSISGKPVFDADGRFRGYRGTGTNITEQVRTEKALRESERQLRLQSDRAEEASRAKSEFLANMSHEIRTPLNAILGFSDSMQREILGPIGNEKYREYASAINASGGHLLELVNDVLDLSKIEAGRYVLDRRSVDLIEVIDGCLQITRETAARKSIQVTLDVPDRFPMINADVRAIKQVILNLLTNALKYTNGGGRVVITLAMKAADVSLQVADTGIGIPKEDIATLTEAFVQGRTNQAYLAHEGTGLGLAITESLVEMHGGFLAIESEVGVGTVVKVSLPNAIETMENKAAG